MTTFIIEWNGYKAFNKGESIGINPEKYFEDNGIKVYTMEKDNEANIYFEVDKLPEPMPEFIKLADDDYEFSAESNVLIAKYPVDLLTLRRWLDMIWDFAVENKEAVTLYTKSTNTIVFIDQKNDVFCAGGKSYELRIGEARPKQYYIDKHNPVPA